MRDEVCIITINPKLIAKLAYMLYKATEKEDNFLYLRLEI